MKYQTPFSGMSEDFRETYPHLAVYADWVECRYKENFEERSQEAFLEYATGFLLGQFHEEKQKGI